MNKDLRWYTDDLVAVMRANRARHHRKWRNVREARIGKLWPELAEDQVRLVIEAAVADGLVERSTVEDRDTGDQLPALRLRDLESVLYPC